MPEKVRDTYLICNLSIGYALTFPVFIPYKRRFIAAVFPFRCGRFFQRLPSFPEIMQAWRIVLPLQTYLPDGLFLRLFHYFRLTYAYGSP